MGPTAPQARAATSGVALIHSERPDSSIPYFPQINTLRAIAVGLVFFDHYMHNVARHFDITDGVLLFFVISGFLITGILLNYRDEMERHNVSLGNALGTFYIRRTLRIFPAYYLMVFVMIAVGMTRDMAPWHLTYTTNIWSALNDRFAPDGGHFWTLAVEEQFYLFWPLVVLMAPRRWLPWFMVAAIIFSLGCRVASIQYDWGLARRTLTITNLYSLLGGGLLGWIHHTHKIKWIELLRRYGHYSLFALLVIDSQQLIIFGIVRPVVLTFVSIYLIDQCVKGFTGWLGWFMSLPFLLYLGTISYGLYLCHMFVMNVIGPVFPGKIGLVANAAIWTVASILLASASWFLMEKPINDLKSRFRLRPALSGLSERSIGLGKSNPGDSAERIGGTAP